jgi:type IV secretion system protein VirD4
VWEGAPGSRQEEESWLWLEVAALYVLLGSGLAAVLLWAAGEVAGRLFGGAWPVVGPGDLAGVLLGTLRDPGHPARAWPVHARHLLPGAGPYWLTLVLLLALVAVAVWAGASWWLEGRPWGRVPWRMRAPARLAIWRPRRLGGGRRVRLAREPVWLDGPFLGFGRRGLTLRRCFIAGRPEDSVAIVGPPRVNKTTGLLIPQVALWPGPVVSVSTKPEVLEATLHRRRELARANGGDVHLYAPTENASIEGIRPMRWSPLDRCEDPITCELRVRAMIGSSAAGRRVEDADHWRTGAARILLAYFHAAALDGGDFRTVRRWLGEHAQEEPAAILRGSDSPAGEVWAGQLDGVFRISERERGSFFSAADTALAATRNPVVLASCAAADLDVERFLGTGSTLYVVSPASHQQVVAPLVSALIESIVEAAYRLHLQGRLPRPLQLNLDELVNNAPLPSLLSILSQGGGLGVIICWAVQSLAQLRDRYGEQMADACWSASRARLVFGGLTDAGDLERISKLAGEREVLTHSETRGLSGSSSSTGQTWRPWLPISELRRRRTGQAFLLYHTLDPVVVRVPRVDQTRVFRELGRARMMDRAT